MDEVSGLLFPRPVGYEEALERAWRALQGKTAEQVAAAKGLTLQDDLLIIPFLGENYLLNLKEKTLTDESGEQVYPFLRVLLLHYACGEATTPPTGNWLSFRQLRGGQTYYPAFAARTVERLKERFGGREDEFAEAAKRLGGRPLGFPDVSFAFDVFPYVCLGVVLNRATEEFGAEAVVLFDEAAQEHLETEDLAVCGAMLVGRLVKG